MTVSQLNPANLVTIARILLIPAFLVLFFLGPADSLPGLAATAVFLLASASDGLDGYLARRAQQVTPLGQFLDPLADKFLMAAAFIALAVESRISVWIVVIVLGREIAVSVLRTVAASQGVSIPADGYGKLKTVLQIIYITYLLLPVVLMATFLHLPVVLTTILEWALAIAVVAVTLFSGVRYFLNARGVVRFTRRRSAARR